MDKERSMDQAFIKQLDDAIETHLEDEQFGVEELAEVLGLSRSQLHRKLNAINGKSTSQYIREYRLEKAMEMLQNNVATASEIAYRVGFSSPTYFNTSFKEFYGYPPGEVKFRGQPSYIVKDENQAFDKTNISVQKGKWLNKQKMLIASLFGLILMALLLNYYAPNLKDKISNHGTKSISEVEKTIAVLPFKNLSSNKENQYFADGVMEDILNQLSKIKEFKVISRSSMEQYRENIKTIPQIAKELKVSYIIESSIQVQKDSVRIIIQLIDAKKDVHIWSKSFERLYENIFVLESEIARQVAVELKASLSPSESQQIDNIPTKNIEAYNLYLKGKYFGSKAVEEDIDKGIKYLEQAIKIDPEFALAYSELAGSILKKNIFGITDRTELVKAKEMVLKSIVLDHNISNAHTVLAIFFGRIEWNWEKAEKEFKLALSLNPSDANAHFHYAKYLHYIKGDFVASRQQMDQALLLDPLSYFALMLSAEYYLQESEFEKAFLETSRAQEIDKNNLYSYWINFQNYVKQGKDDKAIDELEKSWNIYPGTHENAKEIRNAYNKSGIKGIYKWIIDLDENSGNPYMKSYWLAQNYAFYGEKNKALEWLEITLETNPIEMHNIKYDPYFYNLHNTPRFLAILQRMNLGNYE